jgi:hypothetical protein
MHLPPHPWLKVKVALTLVSALSVFGCFAACSTVPATSSAPPTATAGDIRITINQSQFNVTDPVGVMVTNSGNQTYYAVTGRSGCTFLQLQQYTAATNTWKNVFGCQGTTPTIVQITPQISEPFTLAPNSSTNPNVWDPGAYRVSLPYGTQANGSDASLVAYSGAFTIVSG